MEKSEVNQPFGLVWIAVFYIFGAVNLRVLLFADPAQTDSSLARASGPPFTGSWILPVIAGFT